MEYKRICNSCGKVFCFTDEDMKNNVKNAGLSALSALGSLSSTLGGGTVFHSAHLQGQSNRYMDKVVDFDRCPYCHSRNISSFTGNAADVKKKETPTKPTKVITINGSASTEALLKRAYIFLEDEDWESADAYCEACLDKNPELAEAYIAKLMAELHVKTKEELKDQKDSFDKNNNYQKALRYADDELKNVLIGYIEHINTRNENARKDKILSEAKSKMSGSVIANYEKAISLFGSIAGWKDADEKKEICQKKVAELKAKEEAERIERERLAEIARQKAEEEALRKAEEAKVRAAKNKKIAMIVAPIVCVIIVAIVVTTVVIPNNNYNAAVSLMEAGKYQEAIVAFEELGGYKDSSEMIKKSKYLLARSYIARDAYEDAIVQLVDIAPYGESESMLLLSIREVLKTENTDVLESIPDEYQYLVSQAISEKEESERREKDNYIEKVLVLLTGITKDNPSYTSKPIDRATLNKAKELLNAYDGDFEEKTRLLEEIALAEIYFDSKWKFVSGDPKFFNSRMQEDILYYKLGELQYSRDDKAFYYRMFLQTKTCEISTKIFYVKKDSPYVLEYWWLGGEDYRVTLSEQETLIFREYDGDEVRIECELRRIEE